jgi:hypothetical protein
MSSVREIDSAIAAGLELIKTSQLPSGGFLAYLPGDTTGHLTTFTPSLIGMALGSAFPRKTVAPIMQPLSRFLLREKSAVWTFNYWSRTSRVYIERPYPDDLDDTFCALSALHLADPELLQPADYAAIIKLLVAQETAEGGPYRTWVVPPSADPDWQDIDLAVNSNIAYFLRLQDMNLPKLAQLAETAIIQQSYVSPYYPGDSTLLYFIARFYTSPHRKTAAAHLISQQTSTGDWGSPTATALAIAALLNLGRPAASLRPAVEYLLASRTASGWPAGPVYIEENGHTVSAPALTAALVCEALAKYQQAAARPAQPKRRAPRAADTIYRAAVAQVKARFEPLDEDFRRAALAALERLIQRDTDQQIALLPYLWAKNTKQADLARLTPTLIQLGAASIFGWLAYTIYDDFLDEEGEPRLLPVANIALRALSDIFTAQFPDNPQLKAYTDSILDQIESANAWEVTHCRAAVAGGKIQLAQIPDYGDLRRLAQRSLGHALGPVCLQLGRGDSPDSQAVRQTLEFFEHYIIARQLNDDVHDWEADLSRGHINAIGARLLKSLGDPPKQALDLLKLIKLLREKLWNEQILIICAEITRHVELAQAALDAHPSLEGTTDIAALLRPIEASVAQASEGSTATKEFLSAFQRDVPMT